jgi:hypothetical protein
MSHKRLWPSFETPRKRAALRMTAICVARRKTKSPGREAGA